MDAHTPEKSFAARMRARREEREEAKIAETRAVAIEGGAADLAWQQSYRMTYAQFGAPTKERREGLDYFMEWHDREGRPAVILNLGAVHSFMKRQTRTSVVQALVSCAAEYISAPRTKITFVAVAPPVDFRRLFPLEAWSAAEGHVPLRVIQDPKADVVRVFVRANGPTDWFGKSHDRERPVMVFEIP